MVDMLGRLIPSSSALGIAVDIVGDELCVDTWRMK
jgi:hypothetical protein